MPRLIDPPAAGSPAAGHARLGEPAAGMVTVPAWRAGSIRRAMSSSASSRRLRGVAEALAPQPSVEPASAKELGIAAVSLAAGAAIAYSFEKFGYPRAPMTATPVPGIAAEEEEEAEAEEADEPAVTSPSPVGGPVEALDTPALLIDLDALEHNIATFAQTLRAPNVVWRPHCKAVRSPELALMLVAAGAVGVTCAKLSQAAALVDGGIKDVLIANEVVSSAKVSALIALAEKCTALCVAVDDEAALR